MEHIIDEKCYWLELTLLWNSRGGATFFFHVLQQAPIMSGFSNFFNYLLTGKGIKETMKRDLVL